MKKHKRNTPKKSVPKAPPQSVRLLTDAERSGIQRSLLLSSVGIIENNLNHLKPDDLPEVLKNLKALTERLESTIAKREAAQANKAA